MAQQNIALIRVSSSFASSALRQSLPFSTAHETCCGWLELIYNADAFRCVATSDMALIKRSSDISATIVVSSSFPPSPQHHSSRLMLSWALT